MKLTIAQRQAAMVLSGDEPPHEPEPPSVHTRAGKRRIIKELMTSALKEILEKVSRMPNEWDGIELREYLADYFDHCRHMGHPRKRGEFRTRLRDYQNTCYNEGL